MKEAKQVNFRKVVLEEEVLRNLNDDANEVWEDVTVKDKRK